MIPHEFAPLILIASLVVFPITVLAVLSIRNEESAGQEIGTVLANMSPVNKPLMSTGLWVLSGLPALCLAHGLDGISPTGIPNGSIGLGVILLAVLGFQLYRRKRPIRTAEEAMRKLNGPQ